MQSLKLKYLKIKWLNVAYFCKALNMFSHDNENASQIKMPLRKKELSVRAILGRETIVTGEKPALIT